MRRDGARDGADNRREAEEEKRRRVIAQGKLNWTICPNRVYGVEKQGGF